MEFVDDPAHAWIRGTWATQAADPRVSDDERGGTDDEDDQADHRAGDRPLPRRAADDRSTAREAPLFPGVFAIFGHGNVTRPRQRARRGARRAPVHRGQNEQGMALAAVAYAKAMRRRQIMVATSSIGPGATNMVTAAAPRWRTGCRCCSCRATRSRAACPIPCSSRSSTSARRRRRSTTPSAPVTRYWDRIVAPAQVVQSLPLAVATMLDPADCGPAFLGLAAGRAGRGATTTRRASSSRACTSSRAAAPRSRASSTRRRRCSATRAAAAVVAGGGVHYSLAEEDSRAFVERHGRPGGRDHGRQGVPRRRPPVAGSARSASPGATTRTALAAEADVVLAVGTRLQDFTTGSWTVFGEDDAHRRAQRGALRRRASTSRSRSWAMRARGWPRSADALGDWRRRRGVGASARARRRRRSASSSRSARALAGDEPSPPTRRWSGRSTASRRPTTTR